MKALQKVRNIDEFLGDLERTVSVFIDALDEFVNVRLQSIIANSSRLILEWLILL